MGDGVVEWLIRRREGWDWRERIRDLTSRRKVGMTSKGKMKSRK